MDVIILVLSYKQLLCYQGLSVSLVEENRSDKIENQKIINLNFEMNSKDFKILVLKII